MNTIKFSHKYLKMPQSFVHATYLDIVFVAELEDIDMKFITCDTAYLDNEGKIDFYTLPKKGKYLVLLLHTLFHQWTTVRRWTPHKEKYYESLIGQEVKIAIS